MWPTSSACPRDRAGWRVVGSGVGLTAAHVLRSGGTHMTLYEADSRSGRERGIAYAGALGPRGLFPSTDNLRSPQYLRMLLEIKRFHRQAIALLAAPEDDETLRRVVARVGSRPIPPTGGG